MQIRNARYNRFLTIDCEIEHPDYGWIPFTASPDDTEPHSREIFDATKAIAAPFAGVPLDELKAERRALINHARDAACLASVTAIGHTWQADARSQELLANAVRRAHAGKPLPPVWRDADNVDMPVATVADLEEIEDAIAAQTLAAYQQSWALKAQIDGATTAAEVEAVQW